MRFLPCLFVGLLLGGSLPVTADILYSVTDLGTLGGDYSIGLGLNNAGQVTGWSNASAPAYVVHAFLYSNGQMTDLGTLGGSQSFGSGINNAGQVTGYAALPLSMPSDPYAVSVNHAFLYSNGQMTDLGTLDGSFSIGNSINNAG
jgi:probable HAF family extracellular repeat protein